MKIRELEIRNFKSFADYNNPDVGRLSDMANLNMIYGANSSGKSNILKFIELIFSSKFQSGEPIIVEGEPVQQRGAQSSFWKGIVNESQYIFHKNDRNLTIKFNFLISVSHQELQNTGFQALNILVEEYGVAANDSNLKFVGEIKSLGDFSTSEIRLINVKLNEREMFLDDGQTKHYFRSGQGQQALLTQSLQFENFMSLLNGIVLFLDTDRFLAMEHENAIITRLTAKNFKNWFHNLSLDPLNHKKYSKFLAFVREQENFGPFFTKFNPSFSRHGQNIEVMISIEGENYPLESYGTGIQQMLFLLAIIFESRARIILIEELELNLSPKAQKNLFQALRQLISNGHIDQVIFTTHSSYFKFTTDFCFYEVTLNRARVTRVEKVRAVRRNFFLNNPIA